MTADRERQRERLADLIAPRIVSGRETTLNVADHLLDNGVTVELPPEPLTKDAVERVAHFAGFGLTARQRDVLREALAPYVAGGPR